MSTLQDIPPVNLRRRHFITEWFLLLGSLTVLGGTFAFSLYREHAAIDSRERERLTVQAKVIHDNLVRQLDGMNRALQTVLENMHYWQGAPDSVERANIWLRSLVSASPGMRTMAIHAADSRVIASSRPELIGHYFPDRPYYTAVRSSPSRDNLYVTPPFKTALDAWVINVARMVPSSKGEFAGVVTATLDPEMFSILLESVRYANDMRVGIAHGDGTVFVTAPAHKALFGKNIAQPGSFFDLHVMSGRGESFQVGMMATTEDYRMGALRTIKPEWLGMDKPLVVAVSRDVDAVFTDWRQRLKTNAVLFLLLTLTSCAGLATLQRRRCLADEASQALRQKVAEIDRFFAVSIDLFAIFDMEGRFLKLNPAWEKTLGYQIKELEGTRIIDLVHPDDKDTTLAAAACLAKGEGIVDFTNRHLAKSGEYRHIEWHSVSVPDEGLIYGAARDVTERYQTQEALREMNERLQVQAGILKTQAYVDGLTGVANRRRFDEALESEWRRCRRDRKSLAVLLIDIDYFKLFNDHYGHQAGDAALQAVAKVLKNQLGRSHDLVARYGGEEFVCLLPDSDLSGASSKGDELRRLVMELNLEHVQSQEYGVVTISVGVAALIPEGDVTDDMLVARADAALYEAKRAGRNRVCWVPPSILS
jgi:diguanylate cyclase (GGDEF)-like protein/PAS domain S-box-containing protein